MNTHSFEPAVAQEVGVIAATIYQSIRYWCEQREKNCENVHEGRAWVFNSVRAWAELFPYLTPKQIRTALEKLVEASYIGEGNFNRDNRDRTKWYCDLRRPICLHGQMRSPERASPTFAQKGEPLPILNTNSNNTVASDDATECDSQFEATWKGFPKTGFPSKQKAKAAWKRLSKTDREKCATGAAAYARWHADEVTRRKDVPALHLATFINQRRWADMQVEPEPECDWYSRVRYHEVTGEWHPDSWGPAPGQPGCKVPRELLIARLQAKARAA